MSVASANNVHSTCDRCGSHNIIEIIPDIYTPMVPFSECSDCGNRMAHGVIP